MREAEPDHHWAEALIHRERAATLRHRRREVPVEVVRHSAHRVDDQAERIELLRFAGFGNGLLRPPLRHEQLGIPVMRSGVCRIKRQ